MILYCWCNLEIWHVYQLNGLENLRISHVYHLRSCGFGVFSPFLKKQFLKHQNYLEPQTTSKKWMFGETTISYVKIGNRPIDSQPFINGLGIQVGTPSKTSFYNFSCTSVQCTIPSSLSKHLKVGFSIKSFTILPLVPESCGKFLKHPKIAQQNIPKLRFWQSFWGALQNQFSKDWFFVRNLGW